MMVRNGYAQYDEKKSYVGNEAKEIQISDIEEYLKREITMAKNCGCPKCNERRQFSRAMQYLITDYKALKERQ